MGIKILGKDRLKRGFSQNVTDFNNFLEYEKLLYRIKDILELSKDSSSNDDFDLITTSMPTLKYLKACDYNYVPSIIKYDKSIKNIFSPEYIYQNCLNGTADLIPAVDFIAFKKSDKVAAMTFSKGAPIVIFGVDAFVIIGTLFKPVITNEKVMNEFIRKVKLFGNNIHAQILLSTFYYYEDIESTLPDYLYKILKKNGISCSLDTCLDTESDETLFAHDDKYNNLAIYY